MPLELSLVRESGGIGRRTSLRSWRGSPWGFESPFRTTELTSNHSGRNGPGRTHAKHVGNTGPARAPLERRRAAAANRRRSRQAACAPGQDRRSCRASGRARCRSRWSRSNTARRCAPDVISDAVQTSFNDAVREQNLRVAGYPRIEPRASDRRRRTARSSSPRCSRSIPKSAIGDVVGRSPSSARRSRSRAADVDRTLDVLRRAARGVRAGRRAARKPATA